MPLLDSGRFPRHRLQHRRSQILRDFHLRNLAIAQSISQLFQGARLLDVVWVPPECPERFGNDASAIRQGTSTSSRVMALQALGLDLLLAVW